MSNVKKFDSGKIDFLGLAKFLVPATVGLVILGMLGMLFYGLKYGIDFEGGTEVQIRFEKTADVAGVRSLMDELGFKETTVQGFGESNEILVRFRPFAGQNEAEANKKQNEMMAQFKEGLDKKFTDNKAEFRRVDSVGPQVGDQLKRNAILATFYSMLAILIYIGLRFDYKYAPGAVICLFHDTILTLGVFLLLGMEVSIQTMAAILTLIGYSLNDTIITFDRIRENAKLYPDVDFSLVVNRSVNDMFSRSVLTSFTTALASLALWLVSDGVIREIGFTMFIGVVIGTYSSIYIASPLVILVDRFEQRRAERVRMTAKA